MKIETLELAGMASALEALRLPYGKGKRSLTYATRRGSEESLFVESKVVISSEDKALLKKLLLAGDEHAKVLRGVVVWTKITAPVYWWAECETYICGHQRLCSESTMHIDCKGLKGEELQQAKAAIPMGRELTKVDFFSYQCLRHIYRQRRNHRLPEWREFCTWIEALPLAKEFITYEGEEVSDKKLSV